MKQLLIVSAVWASAVLMAACDKPAAVESVESLLENPARLRALRAQCKADHDKVGDAQCHAVVEATRQRFMGQGTPYTPKPAAPGASEASAP